jgi:hypothetical protein
MLSLSSSEIRIIRVWAEKSEESPFPREKALFAKIKNNLSNREMKLTARELEIVLHWAELETKGHHGTDQYLLELEELLINKIESYLNERGENFFATS